MTDQPQPTEALIIRPGDTLIVRYSSTTSAQDLDAVSAELRKRLPDDVKILVLNAEQIAAYRPDTP